MFGGDLTRRRRITLQVLAGDAVPVHLVGSVVEACGAGGAIHELQRQIRAVAERAVDLDGAVDDVVQDAGAEELDQRDVLARRGGSLLVDPPGGVQRHQSQCLDLGGRIGDPVAHCLLVGEHRTVGRPIGGALAHHVEGASGLTDPPHAVMNPARAQPDLRDDEPIASPAEHGVGTDLHVGEVTSQCDP